MAQSRIYEEEEESKHMSTDQENPDESAQDKGEMDSEDLDSDSEEEEDDDEILIKPKDLIVSSVSPLSLMHIVSVPI